MGTSLQDISRKLNRVLRVQIDFSHIIINLPFCVCVAPTATLGYAWNSYVLSWRSPGSGYLGLSFLLVNCWGGSGSNVQHFQAWPAKILC